MITYEKVRCRLADDANPVTLYLQDPHVEDRHGRQCLVGTHVDRDGGEVEPPKSFLAANGARWGIRQYVIDLALVSKRTPMVMDHKYAWLVPAGTATQDTEDPT